MKTILYGLASLVIVVGQSAAQGVPPELIRYADLVLYNGNVLTADKNFTVAEAVAVRDGKILAVGSNKESSGSPASLRAASIWREEVWCRDSSTAMVTTLSLAAICTRTRWSTASSARKFAARTWGDARGGAELVLQANPVLACSASGRRVP